MRKAKDIAFTILCAVALFAVMGFVASGALGACDVPARSSLEGRAYTEAPALDAKAIAKGEFQDQVESFLADHVPMRDGVVLANAALQRNVIATANGLFSWDTYPTTFNSSFVEIPSRSALVVTSKVPRQRDVEAIENWADKINAVAAAHPDVTFVYDVIDDTYTSSANPTHGQVTGAWTKEWIDEHLIDRLDEAVTVIYDPIESQDELFEDWFKTEHHWQLKRAHGSYNKIAQQLGWEEVAWENPFTVTDKWYGSSARSGLDLDFSDNLVDIPADYSNLECAINGKPATRGKRQAVALGQAQAPLYADGAYNVFSDYFGGIRSGVAWDNTEPPNDKTCLFVEQSYGPPLEPYIARNYARMVCADPVNNENKKSFEQRIEESDVDEVVIQLGVRDLIKIAERSPGWTTTP